MKSDQTFTDKMLRHLRNNPFVSVIIIISIILVGLGTITDSIEKIKNGIDLISGNHEAPMIITGSGRLKMVATYPIFRTNRKEIEQGIESDAYDGDEYNLFGYDFSMSSAVNRAITITGITFNPMYKTADGYKPIPGFEMDNAFFQKTKVINRYKETGGPEINFPMSMNPMSSMDIYVERKGFLDVDDIINIYRSPEWLITLSVDVTDGDEKSRVALDVTLVLSATHVNMMMGTITLTSEGYMPEEIWFPVTTQSVNYKK